MESLAQTRKTASATFAVQKGASLPLRGLAEFRRLGMGIFIIGHRDPHRFRQIPRTMVRGIDSPSFENNNAADESHWLGWIKAPDIRGSHDNRFPIFRDLIAGLTGPAEHFRAHMREDHAPSANLRQFRG